MASPLSLTLICKELTVFMSNFSRHDLRNLNVEAAYKNFMIVYVNVQNTSISI